MNYADALAWLNGHINFETGVVVDRAGVKPWTAPTASPIIAGRRMDPPTLQRMENLLGFLGDPQLDLDIIHITGTNGKGSAARMLTSLLIAAGQSVGTTTSPHLASFHERVLAQGQPISSAALADQLTAVALAEAAVVQRGGERASWFEIVIAAAFRWFNDIAVDVAIVEVGAGGTFDATNVADGQVAVVTNVTLDHVEWFGPTTADIAREKSGIIKAGATAVIGETDPDLVAIFERRANDVDAALLIAGVDFACDSNRLAVGGRLVNLRTPRASYPQVFLPLHGSHQGDNAAVALAAAEAFLGDELSPDIVTAGFAEVTNPGRLEVMTRDPLTVIDGAHNVAGVAALGAALADTFAAKTRWVVVLGILGGRDPAEIIATLRRFGDVAQIIAVAPPTPRALDPNLLIVAARDAGIDAVIASDAAHALLLAQSDADDETLVIVCGSLYLVAAARAELTH